MRKYQFDPIIRVEVKSKKGKIRQISLLTIRDKIVQTAILKVIEPIIDAQLTKACFGFRRGLGIDDAVRAVTSTRKNNLLWGVKADIEHFFDAIDQDILNKAVISVIEDKKIVGLIHDSVKTPVICSNGNNIVVKKGIPQGAATSPILSNLYLNSFDKAISGKRRRIIRYCDDFLIFCETRFMVEQALKEANSILASLKLRIKPASIKLINFGQGFSFLGYRFLGKTITSKL